MKPESTSDSMLDCSALEERILYSASPLAALLGKSIDSSCDDCDQDEREPSLLVGDIDVATSKVDFAIERSEIVFIDVNVEDYELLLGDIEASNDNGIEIVFIDSAVDGIEAITQTLAERTNVSSVHIVSHGESGTVRLGNAELSADTIESYAGDLARWNLALNDGADLLFYGCELASSDAGELLVDEISLLTGADVAASDDLTGHVSLGGDWDLEYATGSIETGIAFEGTQDQWFHVLATYTVTNTNDSGTGSLREAMTLANANAGLDTIQFSIAGAGVHSISLDTALPTIVDDVILDATTQAGGSFTTPLIALTKSGAYTGADTAAILIHANNSTVNGFIVGGFADDGIEIADAGGTVGNNNIIEDNWIGFDATGAALGNAEDGILITGNSDGNVVRNNVIGSSGVVFSTGDGIHIRIGADNNWIWGNTIGLGTDGFTVMANAGHGIHISANATNNLIGTNSDSVGDVLERNIISGNSQDGVHIDSSNANIVAGNYLGTNEAGDAARANAGYGVRIVDATDTQVGDGTIAGRNVISGNTSGGVLISNGSSDNNRVQGNYIGLNAAGDAAIANGGDGVNVWGNAANSIIGGTTPGQRNVISGNTGNGIGEYGGVGTIIIGNYVGTDATGLNAVGNSQSGIAIVSANGVRVGGTNAGEGNVLSGNSGTGVFVQNADGTIIQGNYIGVGQDSTTALGNNNGVFLDTGSVNSLIGGVIAAAENVIAYSSTFGVFVGGTGTSGNSIRRNQIFGNSGLGIDLNGDGVTANDPGDADSGPNDLTNTLELNAVTTDGANFTFYGSYDGPGGTIDFYANSDRDGQGYGQGERFLATVALGAGPITLSQTIAAVLNQGEWLTAVVTDSSGNSSEFSNVAQAVGANDLVVNTTADVVDGTVTSFAALRANVGADGRISLREAIEAINNENNGATLDQITFDLYGNDAGHFYYADDGIAGQVSTANILVTTELNDTDIVGIDADFMHSWWSIQATDGFPITDTMIIDATSQRGYIDSPIVEIDGSAAGGGRDGLELENGAAGSTLRGFAVNRFGDDGIDVNGDGNTVAGNIIGLDISGTIATGYGNGGDGIDVDGDSNVIGGTLAADRNIISGNAVGMEITGDSNVVIGNYIGTDVSGTIALGNADGIVIQAGGSTNTIGGVLPNEGNLISGNLGSGVVITGAGSDDNFVLGNLIGTDATGTVDLGNSSVGVYILNGASNNTIGNSTAGNVISGNDLDGVAIYQLGSDGNTVQGNLIGTDITGTSALGNGRVGVYVVDGASGNIIGGTNPGEGNVIADSGSYGVVLFDGGANNVVSNSIVGNFIGTDLTETLILGNADYGVALLAGATNTMVGGTTTAAGNAIVNNANGGVRVTSTASGNSIRLNRIHDNGGLGIDLNADGVTLNDLGDVDTGPNDLLNVPVIYDIVISGGNVTITGEARPGATIDFYKAANDGGTHGGATDYIGSGVVSGATPGDQDPTARFFSFVFATGSLTGNDSITAVATDVSNNSSEFAANLLINIAPTFSQPAEFTSNGQSLGTSDSLAIAVGDVDNDGDLDFVAANFSLQGNQVYLNDGFGNYTATAQVLGASNSDGIVLGDVDGDGDLDMVVANNSGLSNRVYVNDGTGIFTDSGQSLGGGDTVTIAMGDVDGDGDLDAVFGNYSGQADTVYINDGTGTFTDSGQTLNVGVGGTRSIVLGDIDGDGDVDMAIGTQGSNLVMLNDGTGVFTDSGQALGGSVSYAVAFGDFDNDGDLDLVESNFFVGNKVYFNDGSGTFTDSGQNLGSSDSSSVSVGDIDGDGDLDLVVGNFSGQANRVYLNDGSGTFADSGLALGTSSTRDIELGDFDGDGDLDVLAANDLGQANSVFLNDSAISNLAALNVTEGDPPQTITGDGIVGDVDSADFDGGNLTIGYSVIGDAGDQLSVRHQGSGAGQIGFDGTNVSYEGILIGVVNVTNNGANGNTLTIDLNASATPNAVTALLRNITFENTSDAPAASRSLSITVNDGDGGISTNLDQVVTVTAVNDAPNDLSNGIELNLDGGNDVYFGAVDADFLLGAVGHTYEVSFSGLSVPVGQATFYSHRDPGAAQSYLAVHADGTLDWAGLTSTGTYTQLFDGQLHSLAVTWTAATGAIDFYVDGVYAESTSVAPQASGLGGDTFVLGQHVDFATGTFDPDEAFHGTFHDFRVWDHARNAIEVADTDQFSFDASSIPTGLLANWQMTGLTGGSSDTLVDLVNPGSNDLTLQHAGGVGFIASTADDTLDVDENSANATQVGYVLATDPDFGETHTFTLLDDAGGRFAINATTGEITVADGSLLDFEAASSHNITVEVTDSGGLTYSEVVTIDVNDINGNVAGRVYSDEGTTAAGAGLAIRLIVDGSSVQTATTDALGDYTFTTEIGSGDHFIVYVDGYGPFDASAVSVSDGSDLTGVDLYGGLLQIRDDNGGAATNSTDLATALGSHVDSETMFTENLGDIAVNGDLLIQSGHAFTATGGLTTDDLTSSGAFDGGSGTVDINGTLTVTAGSFTATSGAMTIGNDFTVSGGSFSHNGGSIEFNTSTVLDIDIGTTSLNDVELNKGNFSVSIVGSVDIDGTFTLTSVGNLSGDLLVGGDVNLADTSVGGDGRLTFDGSGNQTWQSTASSDTGEVRHVTINKSGGTLSVLGSVRVDGDWNYTAGNLAMAGSNVIFGYSSSNISAAGMSFNDVTFDAGLYSATITGTMDVGGDLNILSAGSINSGTITVAGDLWTADTFLSGTTLFLLDGSGDQTLASTAGSGTGELNFVEINKSTGTLTIQDVVVNRDWTYTAGLVNATGTVTFDSTFTHNINAAGMSFNHVSFVATGANNIAGNLDVNGDFDVSGAIAISGGSITIAGDLTSTDTSVSGSTTITIDGTGTQTITATGGSDFSSGDVTVNKASGTVVLASDWTLDGAVQVLDLLSGTFDAAGYTVTADTVNVLGGTYLASGTIDGDLVVGSGGTLQYDIVDYTSGQYDTLVVTGDVTLNGGAVLGVDIVSLTGSGIAQDALTYNSLTGTFSGINLTNNPSGYEASALYDSPAGATDIQLTRDPVISLPGGAIDFDEDDGATVIDAGATVTDADGGDFDGGTLTVDFTVGSTTADQLTIEAGGNVTLAGNNVLVSGLTIGTFAGGTNGAALVLTWNANSTATTVQQVVRQVAYNNTSQNPDETQRTVRMLLTDGDGGTSNTETEVINVNRVNDAPVVASGAYSLPTITEDDINNAGRTVQQVIDSAGGSGISDVDGDPDGIAIVTNNENTGTWQYSLDGGSNWLDLGTVSNSSALLLRNFDLVRFQPNGAEGTPANFGFRAWDQTSGTAGARVSASPVGGTSAFSTLTETALISVNDVNDAPILTPGTFTLNTITEDDINNSGQTVASVIATGGANPISDVDGDPEGIAITNNNERTGTWQYSIDGGSNWLDVGTVSYSSALLLGETDLIRFQPNGDEGTDGGLAFLAWDQSVGTAGAKVAISGTGGSAPFSAVAESASISVTDINDAPVVSGPGSAFAATEQIGMAIHGTGFSVIDVDEVDGGATVTLTVGEGVLLIVEGDSGVTISSGNNTGTVTVSGTISQIDNLLTGGGSGTITYTATSDTPSASTTITVTVNDQGNTGVDPGLTGDGSSEEGIASQTITITPVNDAPTVTLTGGAINYSENDSPTLVVAGATVSDPEGSDFDGGVLTVDYATGGTANDRLIILQEGMLAGEVGVDGNSVFYSGVLVGSMSGGQGTTPLSITFNTASDQAIVQEVLQHVAYFNGSDNPSTIARSVRISLTDGDGGSSGDIFQTINVASVADGPIAVDDYFGLDFDGVDDYVNLGSDSDLVVTSTSTMEAWVKPDAYATSIGSLIINKEGEYEVGLSTTGMLRWAFANTEPSWAWHDTGYTVSTGQWTHIAVTYDAGTVNTYINGTLVDVFYGSGDIQDNYVGMDDLRIGGRTNSPAGRYFDGEIDDVRIWNDVRTAAEIQANLDVTLTGGEANLAGHWNFNEGAGSTVTDSTGNSADGLLVDGGAGAAGPIWQGLTVVENNGYVTFNFSPMLVNDIDGDGDVLTIAAINGDPGKVNSSLTLPSGATLTVQTDGDISYFTNGAFDYLAAGQTATDSFEYTVDDGNGNTDTATMTITITGLNDAPAANDVFLTSILEDASNPAGQTIGSLYASDFSDVDSVSSMSGIAVISNMAGSDGSWQYSTDGGSNWFNVSLGGMSDSNALILDTATLVRFVPSADFTGFPLPLVVRAIDDTYTGGFTSGATKVAADVSTNGNDTPFAVANSTIQNEVLAVNDVPVQAGGTVSNLTVDEDSGFTSLGLTGLTYGTGGGTDEVSQTLTYEVTVIPDPTFFGRLYLSDGTTQVTTGFYSLTDIQGMQFETVQDASGVSFFQWRITDSGGTANGGQDEFSQFIMLTVNPINDSPTISANSGLTVNEGDLGTLITSAMLNEGDIDDSGTGLTYTLTTVPTTGTLRLSGTALANGNTFTQEDIDFGRVTYDHNDAEVFVDSFDFSLFDGGEDGATPVTGTFNVTINPVNDNTPVAGVDFTTTVAEESVDGTAVGSISASDIDLPGDTLTYAITAGDPSNGFAIDVAGNITISDATVLDLDFDDGTDLVATITVTVDDGTFSDTVDVTVRVTPVNETPDAGLDFTASVAEESANTTFVGTVNATDVDLPSDTLTYAITAGDPSNGFVIDANGNISISDASVLDLDFDDGTDLVATITVTVDDGTFSDTVDVTVRVTPVNDNMPDAGVDFTTTVTEESANGTAVGSISASDIDLPGDTLTYAITAGDPSNGFAIDAAGNISINDASVLDLDFDDGTNFVARITIAVSDGTNTDTIDVTVRVTPINDNAPIITTTNLDATENQTSGGIVVATDQDLPASSFTWTITGAGADDGQFSIDAGTGALTFSTAPNFEAPGDANSDNVYEVNVLVNDGAVNVTKTITVTVTDANDAPVITTTTFNSAENQTSVGTVLSTDDDLDVSTYTITGGVDQTDFMITPAGVLTFNTAHDFENPTDSDTDGVYEVQVTANDGNGGTDVRTILVAVTDINDAPTASDNTFNVDENASNGTAIGIVAAMDPDAGDTLTFAITAGDPTSIFTIDNSGNISVADGPQLNFENTTQYTLTVEVIDSGTPRLTDTATITIDVNDLNENPTDIGPNTFTVDENIDTSAGYSVGPLTTTDEDTGETFAYTILLGGDAANFTIGGINNDELILNDGVLDFETKPSYSVTVQVTDSGGLTYNETLTINVNGLNENPTVNNNTFNVDENAGNGTAVGTVAATDPDAGDTLTFAIAAGDPTSIFTIDNSGNITVADSTQLDFENTTQYTLTVEVIDSGTPSLADTATITIDVNDLNENPTANNDTFNVDENAGNGTAVGTVAATDPDTGDTLTFAITAGDPTSIFTIDNIGNVAVADGGQLNFENTTQYTLTVEVTDSGTPGLADTATITIDVNDLNEEPVGSDNTVSAIEDVDYLFSAGDFGFSDPEDGHSLAAVRITTLPGIGTLYLDINGDEQIGVGETLTSGNFISVANINAGLLKFKSTPGTFGTGYTSFDFQVQDNGITPGQNMDQSPNTLTIDVSEAFRIEGNIVEDVDGDSNLADAVGVGGVAVYLYQDTDVIVGISAGDSLIETTLTNLGGFYSFVGLLDDTYFVVVDSTTVGASGGYNAGYSIIDVTAEQTYGVGGALVADGSGGTTMLVSAGAAFGGRLGDVSDDASSLLTAEHVTVVSSTAGNDVVNVDSGFSFNIVTGVGDSGQGTLRSFIDNANAIVGDNSMRFVPTVASNESGTSGNWWSVTLSSNLAPLTDGGTTIDGTAYDLSDGVSVLDTNIGFVNSSRTVGVDGLTLNAVARQEFEVNFNGNGEGIVIDADDATVTGTALFGAVRGGGSTGAQIYITPNVFSAGEATVSGNLIGTRADGTDPGALRGSSGMLINGATTITNNYIAYLNQSGVRLNGLINGNSDGSTFENNEIHSVAYTHTAGDAITIDSANNVVRGNYIHDLQLAAGVHPYNGKGIELWYDANNNLIENNSVVAAVTAGIGLGDNASNNTISKNVVTGTTGSGGAGGAGILVSSANAGGVAAGNTITQNQTYNNAGLGIDIDTSGVFTTAYGDGVTANDGAISLGTVQDLMDHPIITTANLSGSLLTISGHIGTAPNQAVFAGSRVELFRAAGDPSGYGEADRYFGFLIADANGNFSGTLSVSGITSADEITATATNTTGSTSEFGANYGVNVAPTDIGPNTFNIDENIDTSGGVSLGQITTIDADSTDPGESFNYSIMPGGDASAFSIGGANNDELILADGVLDFEAKPNYSVTVRITDSGGLYYEEVLTVTVNDLNDAPIANTDFATVVEGGTVIQNAPGVLGNDTDQDGDALSAVIAVGPIHGTVVLNSDGTYSYTHDGSETTSDSFTYEVADGRGGFDQATVNLTITPVNDAPIAAVDAYSLNEGGTLNVAAPGVLANDGDVEGDLLTSTLLSGPTNGTLTLNADGSFTYVHDGSETTTDSFTYRVSDGNGGFDSATVNFVIAPVNDTPVATGESFVVDEGGSITAPTNTLLANDTDSDGDSLTSNLVNGPANGSITLNTDGSFVYIHDGGETVSDSFVYEVSDGNGGTATATVNITITPVNDVPVGVQDSFTVAEGGAINIAAPGLLVNDTDADGDSLTAAVLSGPSNGTLVLNSDGSFGYIHDGSETASDSFTYLVSDGNGGTAVAIVDLTVTPVNDAPVATTEIYGVAEGATLTIPVGGVLDNDVDADGDPLTARLIAGPIHGTITLASDGSFVYVHDGSESTIDSFDYELSDGNGGVDVETVTINISHANDAPTATGPAALITPEDTPLTLTSSNGTALVIDDADANANLSPIIVTLSSTNGVLSLSSTASLTFSNGTGVGNSQMTFVGTINEINQSLDGLVFTPDQDFHGSAIIELDIDDQGNIGTGGALTAQLETQITVTPVNDAPTAVDDAFTLVPGQPAVLIPADLLLSNDSDIDGNSLTLLLDRAPQTGKIVEAANGTFIYTPQLGFFGTDSFTYWAVDSSGLGDIATVTVQILPVAPARPNSPQENTPTEVGQGSENNTPTQTLETISIPQVTVPSTQQGDAVIRATRQSTMERPTTNEIDAGAQSLNDVALAVAQKDKSVITDLVGDRFGELVSKPVDSLALVQADATTFDAYFLQSLEKLSEQVNDTDGFQAAIRYAIGGAGATATFGYLIWSIRSGYFFASMLTSMPVWSRIDPLPVVDFAAAKTAGRGERRKKNVGLIDSISRELAAEQLVGSAS